MVTQISKSDEDAGDFRKRVRKRCKQIIESQSNRTGTNTLQVLDWGDYIYNNGVIQEFERRNEATVNLTSGVSSENNIKELNKMEENYDIVALGSYALETAINQELIQPMDKDKLDYYNQTLTFANVGYEKYKGKTYAIPRAFDSVPLVYNSRKLNPDPSWKELSNTDYKNKIGLRDDAREAVLITCIAHNIDYKFRSLSSEIKNLVAANAEACSRFWETGPDSRRLMNGISSVDLQPMWRFAAVRLKRSGYPIKIEYPTEGVKCFLVYFCIPSGCKNIELAYKFINSWFEWMGWYGYMRGIGGIVPNEYTFDKYGLNKRDYGLTKSTKFIFEPHRKRSTINEIEKFWTEAKKNAI